eukprot:13187439-Alexandrium_andersonii.AAC.1
MKEAVLWLGGGFRIAHAPECDESALTPQNTVQDATRTLKLEPERRTQLRSPTAAFQPASAVSWSRCNDASFCVRYAGRGGLT